MMILLVTRAINSESATLFGSLKVDFIGFGIGTPFKNS